MDLHYEVELALIMGKQVKDLEPTDEKGALEAIESLSSISHIALIRSDNSQQAMPLAST